MKNINIKRFKVLHMHSRIAVWVLLFMLHTAAQDTYKYKGFVYGHPYFEGKTWLSAQNTIDIVASPRLLNSTPSAVSFSGKADKCVVSYLSNDTLYLSISSIVEKITSCYKMDLQFIAPKPVSLQGAITQQAAFYSIKNRSIDTVSLLFGGQNGIINLIKVATSTNTVSSIDIDTLITGASARIISINGSSSSYNVSDTGIWVTGSNGLIRYIPFRQGMLQSETIFDLVNSETVTSYGDGFVTTEAGGIYKLINGKFELVYSANTTLHSVNSKGASGNGIVLINKADFWEPIYSGTSQIRAHNIVADSRGILCEYANIQWNCDTIHDGNSQTSIQSILPAMFMPYMNNRMLYRDTKVQPDTLTFFLSDTEKNYQPPSVLLCTPQKVYTELTSDGVHTLMNADPSLFCDTSVVSMADSAFRVILTTSSVSFFANARSGIFDLNCEDCVLKDKIFSVVKPWKVNDSLLISTKSQQLLVVNQKGSTRSLNPDCFFEKKYSLLVVFGQTVLHLQIPFNTALIKDVSAFNLYGKKLPLRLAGERVVIDPAVHQVVTLKVKFNNGNEYHSRVVMLRK